MALHVHGLNISGLKHLILNSRKKLSHLSKETELLRTELNKLPQSAYSDENKDLLRNANAILNLVDNVLEVEKSYEVYLSKNKVSRDEEILFYTIYTKTGVRKVIAGLNEEDAFTKAGYSEKDVSVIDWVDVGVTNSHTWHPKKRSWIKK